MMDPQDNALTQESLLEHAVWLRRLASELVRDPGAAEDLVQDTWLAALRAKPDPARPLRPWLARVMRNGATQRLRRAAGRLAKESEAARPETVPSARELVERAEQQRYLVDAVLAMPEPYREVLLLRYYEGLTPAQIADSLNMLPATVRTHLHRGILKLRDRLDKKHGGDRKAWVLMLQPLALSIPAPVPMGLLAVGWVAAAAAIIAGLGLGMGWWSAGPGDPALVAESRGGQGGSVLVEPVPGDPSRTRAVDMGAVSNRRVRLRNASTGEPLPGFAVHAKGEDWVSDHGGWLSLPADLDQVELIDDGRLAVRTGSNHEPKAMRGIARRVGAIPLGQDPVDLAVQVGPSFRLQLHGPVVFELSDLRASLQNGGRDGGQVAPVRLADQANAGAWVRFAQVPAGVTGHGQDQEWNLVVRHRSGLLVGQIPVSDVVDGSPTLLSLELRSVAKVQGVIEGLVDFGKVRITLRRSTESSRTPARDHRWAIPAADGSFAIEHLEPGTYAMEITAPLSEAWQETLVLTPGESLQKSIPLEPVAEAGILAGVVGSESGTYAGQLLIFLRDDSGRLVGVFPSTWQTGAGGRSVAPFTFESAPLGPLELDVVSLGSEVAFRVEPAHLVAPNESVQILLRDGEPACDWTFEVFDSESGEALEALDVRYEVQGGAARRFLGERKQDGDAEAVWTWTRIAGEMRWNRFEGPAPWVRLATDAQFIWSVRAEGYAPHVGDQAGFAVLEDGSRHIRVGLEPKPLESEKTE